MDSPNPLARFAHRARTGTALAVAASAAPRDGRVLDYGCGPGLFLRTLGDRRPDLELLGYDPYFPEGPAPGVTLLDDMGPVPDRSIGLFTAFEACEHMTEDELDDFLDQAVRTLTAGRAAARLGPGDRRAGAAGQGAQPGRCCTAGAATTPRPNWPPPRSWAARPRAPRTSGPATRASTTAALRDPDRTPVRAAREWCSPFPALPWPVNSQHFSCWRPGA